MFRQGKITSIISDGVVQRSYKLVTVDEAGAPVMPIEVEIDDTERAALYASAQSNGALAISMANNARVAVEQMLADTQTTLANVTSERNEARGMAIEANSALSTANGTIAALQEALTQMTAERDALAAAVSAPPA